MYYTFISAPTIFITLILFGEKKLNVQFDKFCIAIFSSKMFWEAHISKKLFHISSFFLYWNVHRYTMFTIFKTYFNERMLEYNLHMIMIIYEEREI